MAAFREGSKRFTLIGLYF